MGESVSSEQRGAARWLTIHDDLLRGLTHTLSNRIGTISAIAYMLALKPQAAETSADTLRIESEQLDALLQLLRLLPRRADAVFEPVLPTDAITQALQLQAHHPEFRDLQSTVVVDGDLQPAYVDPAVLTMAVVTATGAAHRAVGTGGHIRVIVSCTTDVVQIDIRPESTDAMTNGLTADARIADDVCAIDWLLGPYGGRGTISTAGIAVVIPTLQAARRSRQS